MLEGRRIFIAGTGSIGGELTRQLAAKNFLFLFDQDETRCFGLVEELRQEGLSVTGRIGDVRDIVSLGDAFEEFKPDAVFNCAAKKHVSPMENAPMEAVTVNVHGTWNLVRLSRMHQVKTFVNTSTDKVVNAECVMGASKKLAEIIVRNAGYVSVRFGNVMSSAGSVLGLWQSQLERGRPLTVTDAGMRRFMMTIPEAAGLMIQAAEIGRPRDIVVLDMGEPVNIHDLAAQILKKAGREELGIKIIGKRPGEQLEEKLMTPEEEVRVIREGKLLIIR